MIYLLQDQTNPQSSPHVGLMNLPTTAFSPVAGLVVVANVRPESMPDPWGPAIAFKAHLYHAQGSALTVFQAYMWGILSGVLELDNTGIPLVPQAGCARSLGEILENSVKPTSKKLPILKLATSLSWTRQEDGKEVKVEVPAGTIIAAYHPECAFFPAAVTSSWPDRIELEQAIINKAKEFTATLSGFEAHLWSTVQSLTQIAPGTVLAQVAQVLLQGKTPKQAANLTNQVSNVQIKDVDGNSVTWCIMYPQDMIMENLENLERIFDRKNAPLTSFDLENFEGVLGFPLDLSTVTAVYYPEEHDDQNAWELAQAPKDRQVTIWRVHREKRYTVMVEAESLTPEDILCKEILVQIDSNSNYCIPQWPVVDIQGAKRILNDIKETNHSIQIRKDKDGNISDISGVVTYQMTTVKGRTITRDIPIAQQESIRQINLAIWPNFVMTGWNYYRLFFWENGGSISDWKWEYRNRDGANPGKPGNIIGTGPVNDQAVVVTDQPPGFVEFTWSPKAKSAKDKKLGFFMLPNLQTKQRGGQTGKCAVDFGTSNTCAASVDIPIQGAQQTHPALVQMNNHWEYFIGRVVPDLRNMFLATDLAGLTEIPSELFPAATDLRTALSVKCGFSIPRPEIRWGEEDKVKNWVPDLNRQIVAGLKWHDSSLWPDPSTKHSATSRTVAVENFLEDFFWNLLAELVQSYAVLEFHFSYPGAFEQPQLNTYQGIIANVLGIVINRSGMRQPGQISYNTEAHSAVVLGMNCTAELHMVVDIGGGTTDFAVTDPPVGGEGGISISGGRYSSMKVGGQKLIAAISEILGNCYNLDTSRLTPDEVLRITQVRMGREIRTWMVQQHKLGDAPFWNTGEFGQVSSTQLDNIAEEISTFIQVIAYYGSLMVQAHLLNEMPQRLGAVSVKVHLIGNGFSLVALHPQYYIQWLSSARRDQFESDIFQKELEACLKGIVCAGSPTAKPDVQRCLGKGDTPKGQLKLVIQGGGAAQNNAIPTEVYGIGINYDLPGGNVGILNPWSPIGVDLGVPKLSARGITSWGIPPRILDRLGGPGKFEDRCIKILYSVLKKHGTTTNVEIGQSPVRMILEEDIF